MENELKTLVLAALLHDIGKFAQRARRPYSKEMEGEYLKNDKGKPTHWHTVYTDYFVEKDLPLPDGLEHSRSLLARVASAHHRPDEKNLLEMSVMIADCLSSGSDRIKDEVAESKGGFRESRLISIFDEIELVNHTFKPPGSAFHSLVPLEAGNENTFPRFGEPKGPEGDYKELFDQFLSELKQLNTKVAFRFFIDSLVSLLEKYTWCIPSSAYKTLSDVSLFDHAFSTAGIAQSLYLYHKADDSLPRWTDDNPKFTLLGGDLSGIQEYIFGISKSGGRGVSKIFRARSFYLQALTRSVLIEIQKRTGLLPVFRVMDSGGKFILLLPFTDKVNQDIEQLDEDVQIWFRDRFKGQLTLNLSWATRMRHQDFYLGTFRSKISEVNEAIERAKSQKLRKTLAIKGPIIEEGYEETEDGNCSLCGIHSADADSSTKYEKEEGPKISICSSCSEQIVYIGKNLPRTNFLTYGRGGKIPLFQETKLSLLETAPKHLDNIFLVETLIDSNSFARARFARHLPLITKEEMTDEKWFDLLTKEDGGFSIDVGQPKTFSMIAKKSRKERDGKLVGRELLSFLKADVDNLGLIFSLGLGERLSAARFSSLSRMLNIFFSEYLVQVIQKDYPDIYVVFAGGDDLFLIGPWWQTIFFANKLRKKFSAFCAGNPDITLSAGIFIAKPRLPMRKAADLVEESLDDAKAEIIQDRIKDSVNILDETVSWEELERLMTLGQKFDKAIEEKDRTKFSSAFLYRLLTYHKMYCEFTRPSEKQIKSGRYLSLAHYDIGRNIKSDRYDNREELEMLYDIFAVGVSERPELDKLNLPLFYAINLNRERK